MIWQDEKAYTPATSFVPKKNYVSVGQQNFLFLFSYFYFILFY